MKKILGLDLGTNSVGWALVSEDANNNKNIIGMGSRIIPLTSDDSSEFNSGNKISKNKNRTIKRTQRKGYDRYQLRRKALILILKDKNMLPDKDLSKLSKLELWGIRNRAACEMISLKELGRVLLHLNQKRGYKSNRTEANMDKKDTDYVIEIKNRYDELKLQNITIGQYLFKKLEQIENFRIKQQIYPREAYIEEYDKIVKTQKKYYKELTKELTDKIKNAIIYYQRKLKSQKALVSICEFESFKTINKNNGKEIIAGPKVAHRSSPINQICKIWETINNIKIFDKYGNEYSLNIDEKKDIFEFLDNNPRLSFSKLLDILKLKKNDGWFTNKLIEDKGLQGNITKTKINEVLKNIENRTDLLSFQLIAVNKDNINKDSGEITAGKVISPDFINQPFYKLWHTIYSINDKKECSDTIIKNFNIDKEYADKLASIDFTTQAYSNKSVKAIRKILPYLMQGFNYSESCKKAGYNHSNSLTKEENQQRELIEYLQILPKNSLRQPVVEKILNQMINVVNSIIDKYGKPDEIRVELARELKQSREERNNAFYEINKRDRENKAISERLTKEYGLRATRNNIIKWRLFHEINNDEIKQNATCIYCGKPFGITSALKGIDVDIEHIIPKMKLFDDSQSNKTLSHRICNENKGDKTAYDYMKQKSKEEFETFIERVNTLYKNGLINKSKRNKLLMSEDKIPKNMIERQLRETQYISRKSIEILQQICHNVSSTSGTVTEYLRRIWGWNEVLMNLQLKKCKENELADLIEEYVVIDDYGKNQKKERIKDWGKRDDHRHHAIDALVVACTHQGYIQRMNTLNSQETRNYLYNIFNKNNPEYNLKKSLLENYLYKQKPFNTKEVEDAASNILISFKSGKKVATISRYKAKGKNKVTGVVVPRGQLSEESVYGKIKIIETKKPLKYLFENLDLIVKNKIKNLISLRKMEFNNDLKKAFASTKKDPIYLDKEKTVELTYGSCFKEEYVMKYPIESIKYKDIKSIVDKKIHDIVKNHFEKYNNNEKEAIKNINNLWYNEDKKIPIRSVRCFTGLTSVEPIKKDDNGNDIGWVKPGNNHHIAIYIDENGEKQEHCCSFWHAVERKKYKLPVIIKNPKEVWDKIISEPEIYPENFIKMLPKDTWTYDLSMQQNEMFIMGLSQDEISKAINENKKEIIGNHLYRVQNISVKDYTFRLHTETKVDNNEFTKKSFRYFRIRSFNALFKLNPCKIFINHIGDFKLQ